MNSFLHRSIISVLIVIITIPDIFAHPAGSMVIFKNTLLWSYVYPIESSNHKGCIMMWDETTPNEPIPWLISDSSGSDFFLDVYNGHLYIIESRTKGNSFEYRLFQTNELNKKPIVISDWFESNLHPGNYGFIMTGENKFLFASYPYLYLKRPDNISEKIQFPETKIKKIKRTSSGDFLIITEQSTIICDSSLNIIHKWKSLIDKSANSPPLGINTIFDYDGNQKNIYLADWGKRTLRKVDKQGSSTDLFSFSPPYTPHLVIKNDNNIFVLASTIGDNQIIPMLIKYSPEKTVIIWNPIEK
ncbi:hypothetical protein [Marinigracilibium pacificum]|uniref:Uncharacterized protein n=1 Tax=Marinigracilibium pacificum TaxID=2729599 RepID=A0A848IW68_9BACT|nr:hypothetical protein [Marinigracilibium pacificum]NMM47491.1 hypothetical protein [Marinigracilibium pacificum]